MCHALNGSLNTMTFRVLPIVVEVTVVLALAACAPTVSFAPAPDATNVACAEIVVRLPRDVADQHRRATDAQATAAWGDPAAILLRCGVLQPGPTARPCISINGIDWVEDDSEKPLIRYVTFGRNPATEVAIDSTLISGSTALVDLAAAVDEVPQVSQCTSAGDGGVR